MNLKIPGLFLRKGISLTFVWIFSGKAHCCPELYRNWSKKIYPLLKENEKSIQEKLSLTYFFYINFDSF